MSPSGFLGARRLRALQGFAQYWPLQTWRARSQLQHGVDASEELSKQCAGSLGNGDPLGIEPDRIYSKRAAEEERPPIVEFLRDNCHPVETVNTFGSHN